MYQGLAQKYRLALNEVNPQLFLDRENTSHKALNATLTRYTMLLFSYLHLCVLLRPETAVWFWFLNFYFTKKSLTNGTKSSFRPFTQTHPRSTFSSICIIICLLHFFLWIISEELQTCLCVCVQSLSHVRLFSTPWTVACQAPLSKGFLRQECWNKLSFPSRDLPDPGIKPTSPVSLALAGRFFTLSHLGRHDIGAPELNSDSHSFKSISINFSTLPPLP